MRAASVALTIDCSGVAMFDICLVPSSGAHWENQWSYLLSNFKPRSLFVIGEVNPTIIPFKGYIKINSAEEIPGTLVLAAPINGENYQGNVPLPTFHHPDECCYMFGSDNHHLDEPQMGARIPDYSVYVPTDTIDNMYSYIAGAVILYDRKVKNG